jgi:hypothetical protein
MSIHDLARKCNLDYAMLVDIENGISDAADCVYRNIADALDWDVETLINSIPAPRIG